MGVAIVENCSFPLTLTIHQTILITTFKKTKTNSSKIVIYLIKLIVKALIIKVVEHIVHCIENHQLTFLAIFFSSLSSLVHYSRHFETHL